MTWPFNPDNICIASGPTRNEVAYYLLNGKRWETCTHCEGEGWFYNFKYRPEEQTIIDELRVRGAPCNVCQGKGGGFR